MEVEIKIPIDEVFLKEETKTYITNKIGSPSEEITQIDTYFQSPIKNFQETDEALRIRQISSKENFQSIEVTYKGPKLGNEMKIREEITINVDIYDEGVKIFERLGFSAVAEVKKRRINWKKSNLTVSLDEVSGLGTYLEIEILESRNSDDIPSNKTEIYDLISEIFPKWSGKEERSSYLELLARKT